MPTSRYWIGWTPDLAQHLDRGDAEEGQGDEQQPVLGRPVAQRVAADRVDEGDAEGFDASAALAAGRRVGRGVAEGAGGSAGGSLLRRRRRQRVQLPGGAKAAVVDRPLERQEATGERRMRPVRRQLATRVARRPARRPARRCRRARARSAPRAAWSAPAKASATATWKPRPCAGVTGAGQHRRPRCRRPGPRRCARRANRRARAAPAARSQLRREPACSATRHAARCRRARWRSGSPSSRSR